MGFFVAQVGSTLRKVKTDGTSSALTLPTGVMLSTTLKPRWAILGRNIILVNSPNRNLWIDATDENLTVRVLVPRTPASPPILATGTGTGLTGDYKVRVSFVVKDVRGKVISESNWGTEALKVTLTNQSLKVTGIPISEDAISARRLYRTTSGGSTYFHWADLEGNTQTDYENNLSDAALSLLPTQSGDLGAPAGTIAGGRLKLVVPWKNRLWAVSTADPDHLIHTEDGVIYAWPATNLFKIPKIGEDEFGITGIVARRDELGIIKRDSVHKIIGDDEASFERVVIAEGGIGCVAPDSIVVIKDIAYWLGEDGVYEWGPEGVRNISRDSVDPWFTEDATFNRSRFENAFAKWNPVTNAYELHLAANGSSNEDRWVSRDLEGRRWLGPHKTAAFTPSAAALLEDANDLHMPVIAGTDGHIYKMNQSARRDGAASAIDYEWEVRHNADTPDIEKLFLELSMLSEIEAAAGTCQIFAARGGLNAPEDGAIAHDLTKGRERLRRIGQGRTLKLRCRENTDNQDTLIYGYEIPYHELGRR